MSYYLYEFDSFQYVLNIPFYQLFSKVVQLSQTSKCGVKGKLLKLMHHSQEGKREAGERESEEQSIEKKETDSYVRTCHFQSLVTIIYGWLFAIMAANHRTAQVTESHAPPAKTGLLKFNLPAQSINLQPKHITNKTRANVRNALLCSFCMHSWQLCKKLTSTFTFFLKN